MDRRDFLKAAGIAIAGAATGCGGPMAGGFGGRRPNVLLVITDDQGYGDMSCHGNPFLNTPNLDALWSQSIRFTNFHVDPTCAPTRSALMTGRYSARVGVWHTIQGRSILRRDEVTMADVFRRSGYRTGIFGKWHLGDNYPYRPQDRGFEESLIHGGGGVAQIPDYWGNDYFDDHYKHNGQWQPQTGYCTDVWFNAATQFIETPDKRPFFYYLATNAPHAPYNVPDEFAAKYRNNPDVPNAEFCGMIEQFDGRLGQILEMLKSRGLDRDTVVIFMTDNGTAENAVLDKDGFLRRGFNAGMRGKKGSVYEGGHRVPFWIRYPAGGLQGGHDLDRLSGHIDVLPTLIELCGLSPPSPKVAFDGTSLMPLFRGESQWPDRTMVVHSQRVEKPEKWRQTTVMTQRWRLVGENELYDMAADPGQRNNLADRFGEIVQKLKQDYDAWWLDVSQRFDEVCRISIGSEKENPVRLTCHDWHDQAAAYQSEIRKGRAFNGYWAVWVERPGRYEFRLCRWPDEADLPIRAAGPGDIAILAIKARLRIGYLESGPSPAPAKTPDGKDAPPPDPTVVSQSFRVAAQDQSVEISESDKAAVFTMELPVGPARIQTWMIDADDAERGAYFVSVNRLPEG
jgi:arylsulfatase A-like enzyme